MLYQYKCKQCGETGEFDSNKTPMMLLEDDLPRPTTYVVNCPKCGKENSIAVPQKNNERGE